MSICGRRSGPRARRAGDHRGHSRRGRRAAPRRARSPHHGCGRGQRAARARCWSYRVTPVRRSRWPPRDRRPGVRSRSGSRGARSGAPLSARHGAAPTDGATPAADSRRAAQPVPGQPSVICPGKRGPPAAAVTPRPATPRPPIRPPAHHSIPTWPDRCVRATASHRSIADVIAAAQAGPGRARPAGTVACASRTRRRTVLSPGTPSRTRRPRCRRRRSREPFATRRARTPVAITTAYRMPAQAATLGYAGS
jgi:hypothetical protein